MAFNKTSQQLRITTTILYKTMATEPFYFILTNKSCRMPVLIYHSMKKSERESREHIKYKNIWKLFLLVIIKLIRYFCVGIVYCEFFQAWIYWSIRFFLEEWFSKLFFKPMVTMFSIWNYF